MASLVFVLSLDEPHPEYLQVAAALDLEAELVRRGRAASPDLQHRWAQIGDLVMNPESRLFQDLIADIEVEPLPLDPRIIDHFI
jgi:hypothetical protein